MSFAHIPKNIGCHFPHPRSWIVGQLDHACDHWPSHPANLARYLIANLFIVVHQPADQLVQPLQVWALLS
jgi:hypothetical protein